MNPDPVPAPPAASRRPVLFVLLAGLMAVSVATAYVTMRPPDLVPAAAAYRGKIGAVERGRVEATKLADGFVDADGDLLADPPATPADPPVLAFAGPASGDPVATKESFEPVRAHLEKELGRKVEYRPASAVAELTDALKDGKLHVAYFAAGAVPLAVNAGGFHPVCSPASADGQATYRPLMIAPAGGPVATPADVKGRALACVSVVSHSGYKAPLLVLRDRYGLTPGADYDIRWTASHAASIRGVAANVYEVAGVGSDELGRAKARGDIRDDQFKVIEEGGPEPMDAFGYAHTLPPALAAKVKAALLSFKWDGTAVADLYRGTGYVKFAPVDYKTDWAEIRKADEALAHWDTPAAGK